MVKEFICPTVLVPSFSKSKTALNYKKEIPLSNKNLKHKRKIEMDQIYSEIKEFSATKTNRKSKKLYIDEKLTRLGAPPPKEQKMPFQQKMGILAGRKKRELKAKLEVKHSGVISAKSKSKNSSKSKTTNSEDLDSSNPDIHPRTRRGFLIVKKTK